MAQPETLPARRGPGRLGTIVTAVLAGFAGGLMAPLLLPRIEPSLRPATKRVFKTGLALYERGRERAAELGEIASDMMAEARAEYEAEQVVPETAGDPMAASEVVRLRDARGKEAGSPNA